VHIFAQALWFKANLHANRVNVVLTLREYASKAILREFGLEHRPASGGRDLEDTAEIGFVVGATRAATNHLKNVTHAHTVITGGSQNLMSDDVASNVQAALTLLGRAPGGREHTRGRRDKSA